jgi:hypothetical protein
VAVYVVLAFDDDQKAKEFVSQTLRTEEVTFGASTIQRWARAVVRGVYKKPTVFCQCDAATGRTRGKKYGWWVCRKCGKPAEGWAKGDCWYTALGTNLLPKSVSGEYRPPGWESPAEWSDLVEP